jgi:hypothetical protein
MTHRSSRALVLALAVLCGAASGESRVELERRAACMPATPHVTTLACLCGLNAVSADEYGSGRSLAADALVRACVHVHVHVPLQAISCNNSRVVAAPGMHSRRTSVHGNSHAVCVQAVLSDVALNELRPPTARLWERFSNYTGIGCVDVLWLCACSGGMQQHVTAAAAQHHLVLSLTHTHVHGSAAGTAEPTSSPRAVSARTQSGSAQASHSHRCARARARARHVIMA